MKRNAKDLEDYSRKYSWSEAFEVGLFFEGIGILLHRRLIDIDLVDDLFSSHIRVTWEKVRDLALEARKVQNAPAAFEWFEYLYNEMQKREQKLQQSKA